MSKVPPYPWRLQNLNIFHKQTLSHEFQIWKIALHEHHRKNSHHPEFFPNLLHMTNLNKKHMLCDLLGSQLGSQWKYNSRWNIAQAANVCKKWSNWKYVADFYVGSFEENAPPKNERWPKNQFKEEKCRFVLWVKCLLQGKISFNDFMTGLYSFKCVEYYVTDLQWHQYAVISVGNELFSDDEELLKDIQDHDFDKWDAFMVAAYILKWIFDIEDIELDEKFRNVCIDGFIYDIIKRGNEKMNK